MQIRTCDITVKSLSVDGVFKGYASVFNTEDAHGDVVCKGAFLRTLLHWRQKGVGVWPKMLWQHAQDQVIGVWTDMREDDKGLYVEGKLLLEVEKAREAYALLREKAVDGLSIGFCPKRSAAGVFNDRTVNFLREVDLMEVSLVTFAANEEARILAVKDNRKDVVRDNMEIKIKHEVPGVMKSTNNLYFRNYTTGKIRELCDYLRVL